MSRELWLVTLLVGLVLALPLLVPSLRILVAKPLWLDELHTWLLARDRPNAELVARLRGGADFNPPLLYAVDHVMLSLFPSAPAQVVLRLTSIVSVGAACILLYRLHRARLAVVPALAGALAPLAHTTAVEQMHEARFYAPWLLLVVAVAWALDGVVEHPRSVIRFVALVLLTAATCLMHYFGVISVGLLALGAIVVVRERARLVRPLGGMALGTLALVAWLPVYAAQRHVLSVPTWIPPADLRESLTFLYNFLTYPAYALVVVAAVATPFLYRLTRLSVVRPPTPPSPGMPSVAQAALLALLLLPIVLIVFSIVVQPVVINRYAIPAVLGGACLVALATARLPRHVALLVVVALVGMHGLRMARRLREARRFSREVASGVAAVNQVAGDPRIVVAMERFSLYPVALSAANRNPRLRYLVMPRDTIRAYSGPAWKVPTALAMLERDGTVAHHAVLGFPGVISLEALRAVPSFFMLVREQPGVPLFPVLFAGMPACRVNARLLLFGGNASAPLDTSTVEIPACRGAPSDRTQTRDGAAPTRSSTAITLTPRR